MSMKQVNSVSYCVNIKHLFLKVYGLRNRLDINVQEETQIFLQGKGVKRHVTMEKTGCGTKATEYLLCCPQIVFKKYIGVFPSVLCSCFVCCCFQILYLQYSHMKNQSISFKCLKCPRKLSQKKKFLRNQNLPLLKVFVNAEKMTSSNFVGASIEISGKTPISKNSFFCLVLTNFTSVIVS